MRLSFRVRRLCLTDRMTKMPSRTLRRRSDRFLRRSCRAAVFLLTTGGFSDAPALNDDTWPINISTTPPLCYRFLASFQHSFFHPDGGAMTHLSGGIRIHGRKPDAINARSGSGQHRFPVRWRSHPSDASRHGFDHRRKRPVPIHPMRASGNETACRVAPGG